MFSSLVPNQSFRGDTLIPVILARPATGSVGTSTGVTGVMLRIVAFGAAGGASGISTGGGTTNPLIRTFKLAGSSLLTGVSFGVARSTPGRPNPVRSTGATVGASGSGGMVIGVAGGFVGAAIKSPDGRRLTFGNG